MADFRTNTEKGYYATLKVTEGQYNILNNTSPCAWSLEVYAGSNFSGYTVGHEVIINGAQVAYHDNSGNQTSMTRGNTYTIASGSINIQHNADGTKKDMAISFRLWMDNTSYTFSSLVGSGTMDLVTIPRASSITATNADIGSPSTIIINRASDTFTHTITYAFGNLTGTITTKTAQTVIGWTIPTSFYQQIPNALSGVGTITCQTYSGDTLVGTTTTEFTANVPSSSKPVIDSATVEDTNQYVIALTGNKKRLVNYCSTPKITATGRVLNYATFSKFRENNVLDLTTTTSVNAGTTTVNGNRSYPGNNRTSFKLVLVDSRGMNSDYKELNQANGDFVVVPYVPLTINAEFKRIAPTTGEVGLRFSGNFYNGYFDANSANFNGLILKWRYKQDGGDWVTEGADDTTNGWRNLNLNTHYKHGSGNTYHSGISSTETIISLGNVFDYKEKYIFQLYYADKMDVHTFEQPVKMGEPCFDYGIDANGNKYLNVNGEIHKNSLKLIGDYKDISSAPLTKDNTGLADVEISKAKYLIVFYSFLNLGNKYVGSCMVKSNDEWTVLEFQGMIAYVKITTSNNYLIVSEYSNENFAVYGYSILV